MNDWRETIELRFPPQLLAALEDARPDKSMPLREYFHWLVMRGIEYGGLAGGTDPVEIGVFLAQWLAVLNESGELSGKDTAYTMLMHFNIGAAAPGPPGSQHLN